MRDLASPARPDGPRDARPRRTPGARRAAARETRLARSPREPLLASLSHTIAAAAAADHTTSLARTEAESRPVPACALFPCSLHSVMPCSSPACVRLPHPSLPPAYSRRALSWTRPPCSSLAALYIPAPTFAFMRSPRSRTPSSCPTRAAGVHLRPVAPLAVAAHSHPAVAVPLPLPLREALPTLGHYARQLTC